jgi:superfamily I DNA and RNA helicase
MRSDPELWSRLQDLVVSEDIPDDWQFDSLIVDEGQDFRAEWVEILQLFLRGTPDVLWLEDLDQGIRGNDPVPLDGFVGYRAKANYRSPESIARFIRKVVPFEFECANDLPGLGVSVHVYSDPEDQAAIVSRIVADLYTKGFKAADISILTLRGYSGSVLSDRERVGNYTLKRFAGEYDLFGNQLMTAGQLRFDSIHRFKGQQAPAIVVVDVESRGDEDDRTLKLLYTAMTRATVRLEILARRSEPLTGRLLAAGGV